VIAAEHATLVAEAYDATRPIGSKLWNELPPHERVRFMSVCAHVRAVDRARHREQLELISGRLDFVIAGLK
jgi:hypothetical protein